MIARHQRNPTRALPRDPITRGIVHRRIIRADEVQSHRPLHTLHPRRPLQPGRSCRSRNPLRSSLPRRSL